MKYSKDVRVLFEKYKKSLAILVKIGKGAPYANMLSDVDSSVNYDEINKILVQSKEITNPDEQYVNQVKLVMSLLDATSRKILIKDYFLEEYGWWFDQYSRASYYRLREYAEEKFLILMGKKPSKK